MLYSIIVPVYNRPQEIEELLESLTFQTFKNFEVIVVEDGSSLSSELQVKKYQEILDIKYYSIPNGGAGFARNFGFTKATGDYYIIFDSDCIIPELYLETVDKNLQITNWDAFGGPDAAHPKFNPIQKAISYAMTSPFTTGGIRGNKKHMGKYHPRSFNLGVKKEVIEHVGGFKWTRCAEDIEFSRRIYEHGFQVGLIPDALVYHKRRSTFGQFYKQLRIFGEGRIKLFRHFPDQLEIVHFFPAVFFLGLLFIILSGALIFLLPQAILPDFLVQLFSITSFCYIIWMLGVFIHSSVSNKSLYIGVLSLCASFVQLTGYAVGFLKTALSNKYKS